ncbi:MAG: efflux RND transporter periplasmic adaptor subunit [Xanthobacteraceae bacterium]|nr:efflux RND transporter periplasmic adaptor subunit [Xanthobacteraceae bacterium]
MSNFRISVKSAVIAGALVIAGGALVFGRLGSWLPFGSNQLDGAAYAQADSGGAKIGTLDGAPTVELNDKQMATLKVEKVGELDFPNQKSAVGNIDFNEDMTLQVFTPYQGRIIDLYAKLGDEVKQGQVLFTIDSPDLLTADSNLIAAAGVLELTTRALKRLTALYESKSGIAQKDLEQAVSDQQTAEGNLKSARDAVRIFGKTEEEVETIIRERRADNKLVIKSPISGRVTARNAAPGLFVQPGSAPAPFSIADISTMWMLANVAESDVSAFKVGQPVKVSLISFPGRTFEGHITTIASTVDPTMHRMLVRSEIDDPNHELRQNMFATFVIETGAPTRSLAVPLSGVVREGDGTMNVWVSLGGRRFVERVVKAGITKDGRRQIISGLKPGEMVATDGAVFLSNVLAIGQAGG